MIDVNALKKYALRFNVLWTYKHIRFIEDAGGAFPHFILSSIYKHFFFFCSCRTVLRLTWIVELIVNVAFIVVVDFFMCWDFADVISFLFFYFSFIFFLLASIDVRVLL